MKIGPDDSRTKLPTSRFVGPLGPRKRKEIPMLKIKRAYDPPSSKDGKRVLIDRLWPRGLKKEDARIEEWLKDLAPSTDLRKWFGHDPAKWNEFKKRYRKELSGKSELIKKIKSEARKGTVTLVFSAKDAEHSNAAFLKEMLKD